MTCAAEPRRAVRYSNTMRRVAPLPWLAALWLFLGNEPSSATAHNHCMLVGVTSVRFGLYDGRERMPTPGSGAISFQCVGHGQGNVVSIDVGRGLSGGFMPRAMTLGSSRLDYNLYLDAARTVIWGDGTSGTTSLRTRVPGGQTISVPVYAQVLPRQFVPPGDYADQVVVTLNY